MSQGDATKLAQPGDFLVSVTLPPKNGAVTLSKEECEKPASPTGK
jgi:hypothetical protein